jgi:hypothetical protein
MKTRFLIFCLSLSIGLFAQSTTGSFEEKVTSSSNVRLAVTNVGTFGNAFRGYRDGTTNESCEYPAGSGTEHVFEAGLWMGAIRNGTKLVSTSALDAPQGYRTGSAGFEFTGEIGSKLNERSTFKDSPFYSPFAVSHEDFVATFSDKNTVIPGTTIPVGGTSHTQPLYLKVNMNTYNFNFAFSDFIVFVDMEVINIGNQGDINLLDSFYFGMWANTVVRNINITPPGSGGAAFYNKGGNGFIDSLNMAYCYDHSGDVGFTNSYVAQKFLGSTDKFGFHHPKLDSTFNSHYNAWEFNVSGTGTFQAPSGDPQRYDKMTNGIDDDPCWTIDNNCGGGTFQDQLNSAGNRSDLVSVGPFRDFKSGDTIKISYAFILAEKIDDGNPNTDNTIAQQAQLLENAARAQTAFNGEDTNFDGVVDADEDKDGNGKPTRFILPSPPDIPKTRVEASENKVDIYWSNNSEASIDPISQTKDFEGYRIYLTKLGFDVTGISNLLRDLSPLAEYDIKGDSFAYEIGLDKIRLNKPFVFDSEGEKRVLEISGYNMDTLIIPIDTLISLNDTIVDSTAVYNWNPFWQIDDSTVYYYHYSINNLLNGWQYAIAIAAFDTGNEEQRLEPLESSLLANNFRVFPGKTVNTDLEKTKPFVYPNPYYFGSSWEGKTNFQEQSRKLVFANLPARCQIRIFTPAGDLIDEIYHDQAYSGNDIKWYESFSSEDSEKNVFSGGEHAWDLLSSYTQIISRGIYIFVVEDLETGETKQGKFTIIK